MSSQSLTPVNQCVVPFSFIAPSINLKVSSHSSSLRLILSLPRFHCLQVGFHCFHLSLYSISQSHFFHITIVVSLYLGRLDLPIIVVRLSSSSVRLFFRLFRLILSLVRSCLNSSRLCQKCGTAYQKALMLGISFLGISFGFVLLDFQSCKLYLFLIKL